MFAVIRLIPSPPAQVEIKKSCFLEFGFTNDSICSSQTSRGVVPSNQQYLISFHQQ